MPHSHVISHEEYTKLLNTIKKQKKQIANLLRYIEEQEYFDERVKEYLITIIPKLQLRYRLLTYDDVIQENDEFLNLEWDEDDECFLPKNLWIPITKEKNSDLIGVEYKPNAFKKMRRKV